MSDTHPNAMSHWDEHAETGRDRMSEERKPKWAWSSVDDPNPHYPKCDHCDAFARWAVGEVGDECTFADVTTRYFACGSHINRALAEADWLLDVLCVYDLTVPPERG